MVLVDALWPDAYQVKIGNENCHDMEIRETEITCLPPKSEPFDPVSDNVRVMVS